MWCPMSGGGARELPKKVTFISAYRIVPPPVCRAEGYNEGLSVRRRHGACRGACSPNPVGEDGAAVELAAGGWAHSSNAVFSDSMCNVAMAAPAMTCYWSAAASRVRSCIPAPSSDARPGVRGDVHQRRAVVRAVLSLLHEIDALV
ncbi:hypothetical protein PVAP13_4KG220805 [Panicum virgatum]|uniref:Uncharacterized protein n=1 Tax=Panicum virgatum TaxID=38727 RepID=A0A8T0TPB7_PANVG|nr:hypothetical protein PVAP13_4KG220805 [Panicum virgatum]